jgi:hypothetical protein
MPKIGNKNDLLKSVGFDERIQLRKSAGARLTPVQREFLAEAYWQSHRETKGLRPRAMTPQQRNLKKTIVDGASFSFADVELLVSVVGMEQRMPTGWIGRKDLLHIVPADRLAGLVSALCSIFHAQYADPIMAQLKGTYESHGEHIVIQREP